MIIAGIAFFTLLIFFIAEFEYEFGGKNTGDVDFLNLASVLLAFNPFVGFADFMFRGCSSESIVGIMSDIFFIPPDERVPEWILFNDFANYNCC